MLNIDCLLHNTDLAEHLRNLVEMISYERAANSRKAGFSEVYNEIRKAGVEADSETIGHFYSEMSRKANDERFTHPDEVEKIVGKKLDRAIRDTILQEGDGTNEKQIGDLPPAKAVVRGLMNVMEEKGQNDENKSIMRTIQDATYRGMKRILGEPEGNKTEKPTPEQWEDILKRTLETEQKGYNQIDGTLNNIRTVFEQAKKEINTIADKLDAQGKYDEAQKYRNAMKSVQDASYSLLFSTREGKDMLYGLLKEGGYTKELGNGKTVIDWERLATHTNDVADLRDNVVKTLKDKGYAEDATRIADALTKDFHDIMGKVQEKQYLMEQQYTEHNQKQDEAILAKKTKAFQKLMQKSNKERIQTLKELLRDNGYGQEDKDGKITIDWAKMAGADNSPQALQQRISDILQKTGYSEDEANDIADKLKEGYDPLKKEVGERAWNKLQGLVKSIEAERPGQRSAFIRMAQLNNMGIFEKENEAVMHNILGTSDLEQHVISKMKDVAQRMSDLDKILVKEGLKPMFATHEMRVLTEEMNDLVAMAHNNRDLRAKIITGISNYADAMNISRIMNVFNMTENTLGNARSAMDTILVSLANGTLDRETLKQAFKVSWSTFKDVGKGNLSYGDVVNKFQGKSGLLEKMVWDPNDNSVKGVANKLGYIAYAPARYMLDGMDSGMKNFKTNLIFKNMVYQCLMKTGEYTKQEANQYLNETLYGQSFEDAKQKAEKIYKATGTEYDNNRILRFANEIVRANLLTSGALNEEVIEAAINSSFKVAGVGLGHEVQNVNLWAAGVKAVQTKMLAAERKALKEGKYGNAGLIRLSHTAIFKVTIPFTVGATNWVVLRIERNLGIGLIVGAFGDWEGNNIDLGADQKKIEEALYKTNKARDAMARGLSGIVETGLSLAVQTAIAAMNDKDKKKMDQDIKDDFITKKFYQKSAPDYIVWSFLKNTSGNKHEDAVDGEALVNYINTYWNIGDNYALPEQLNNIKDAYRYGKIDRAHGLWGQILGSHFETPLWRSYKGAMQLVTRPILGQEYPAQKYKPSNAFSEGFLGGNMLEDLGLIKDDAPIASIAGFGGKLGEAMEKHGIHTVKQLNEHPQYYNYIEDRKMRERAKKQGAMYK